MNAYIITLTAVVDVQLIKYANQKNQIYFRAGEKLTINVPFGFEEVRKTDNCKLYK
jgi:hypothetical protein